MGMKSEICIEAIWADTCSMKPVQSCNKNSKYSARDSYVSKEGYVFGLVRPFVCWFVCLSVSRIMEKNY